MNVVKHIMKDEQVAEAACRYLRDRDQFSFGFWWEKDFDGYPVVCHVLEASIKNTHRVSRELQLFNACARSVPILREEGET